MRTYEVLVEAGQVLQFRRAVGELEAPLEPDGVAPPTFLMAADVFDPEYERRPRSGNDWPGAANRPAGGGAGFHAEQSFTYHRHPRAGEKLTAIVRPGRRWRRKAGGAGGCSSPRPSPTLPTPMGNWWSAPRSFPSAPSASRSSERHG